MELKNIKYKIKCKSLCENITFFEIILLSSLYFTKECVRETSVDMTGWLLVVERGSVIGLFACYPPACLTKGVRAYMRLWQTGNSSFLAEFQR